MAEAKPKEDPGIINEPAKMSASEMISMTSAGKNVPKGKKVSKVELLRPVKVGTKMQNKQKDGATLAPPEAVKKPKDEKESQEAEGKEEAFKLLQSNFNPKDDPEIVNQLAKMSISEMKNMTSNGKNLPKGKKVSKVELLRPVKVETKMQNKQKDGATLAPMEAVKKPNGEVDSHEAEGQGETFKLLQSNLNRFTKEEVEKSLYEMKYKRISSPSEAYYEISRLKKSFEKLIAMYNGICNIVATLDGARIQVRYIEQGYVIGDLYNPPDTINSLMVSSYTGPNSYKFGQFKLRQYFSPKSHEVFAKTYGRNNKDGVANIHFFHDSIGIEAKHRMYIENGVYCFEENGGFQSYIFELPPNKKFAIFSNLVLDNCLEEARVYVQHIKMLQSGLFEVFSEKRAATLGVPDEAVSTLEKLLEATCHLAICHATFDKFGETGFNQSFQKRDMDWSTFSYMSVFDTADNPGAIVIFDGEAFYKLSHLLKYLLQ